MVDNIIYIVGAVTVILTGIIVFGSAIILLSCRRYCCKCVKPLSSEDRGWGGTAEYICPRCNTALPDVDVFTGRVSNKPLRFWNLLGPFIEIIFWIKQLLRRGKKKLKTA